MNKVIFSDFAQEEKNTCLLLEIMADVKWNADEIPSFVRTAEKCNSSFCAHAHTSADKQKRTRTRKQTYTHRDAILKHVFFLLQC